MSPEVVVFLILRMFGIGSRLKNARNASGVGESFRRNHDDGIVRKLTCSSLIDGFRLLRILLSERFHSFLAVVAGLIHGLDL